MPRIHETWTVLPHGPVTSIGDGILTVEGDIPMPLGNFPRRMTVVRLSGGRSLVWSAMAVDEEGMAAIEALGTPSFMVVPNPGHRLDAKIFKTRCERRVNRRAGRMNRSRPWPRTSTSWVGWEMTSAPPRRASSASSSHT